MMMNNQPARTFILRFTVAWLVLCSLMLPISLARAQSNAGAPSAVVLNAEGAVTPVMVGYIERGLKIASDRGADVIILQLNTPGGQIDQMSLIVSLLRASEIPVIQGYVIKPLTADVVRGMLAGD